MAIFSLEEGEANGLGQNGQNFFLAIKGPSDEFFSDQRRAHDLHNFFYLEDIWCSGLKNFLVVTRLIDVLVYFPTYEGPVNIREFFF